MKGHTKCGKYQVRKHQEDGIKWHLNAASYFLWRKKLLHIMQPFSVIVCKYRLWASGCFRQGTFLANNTWHGKDVWAWCIYAFIYLAILCMPASFYASWFCNVHLSGQCFKGQRNRKAAIGRWEGKSSWNVNFENANAHCISNLPLQLIWRCGKQIPKESLVQSSCVAVWREMFQGSAFII